MKVTTKHPPEMTYAVNSIRKTKGQRNLSRYNGNHVLKRSGETVIPGFIYAHWTKMMDDGCGRGRLGVWCLGGVLAGVSSW